MAGVISSWLTARAQVKAVREEYDGRIRELQRERAHELADREAADAEAEQARLVELRRTTRHLVTALRSPDVLQHNVTSAQRDLEGAAAAMRAVANRALAEALLDAAASRDADCLEALIRDR